MAVTLADILRARDAISSVVRNTPMKRSTTLSTMTGADLHLKLENFQRTGSFKVRGATWKVHNLSEQERSGGAVAASAGNHGQGVAFAAARAGIEANIFMPEAAAHAKVSAVRGYGATTHLVGRDYQEAYEHATAFAKERGAAYIHAYDDPHIIAGQGTLGVEIHEDLPDVDTVLVPVGGGGLIAGIATALKALRPEVHIVAVQAEGASSVAPSLQKGRVVPLEEVHTMADGIACRTLGRHTFPAIQEHVDEVVTVNESEIAAAILFLLERTKVVAEGAGAVALAAAMSGHVQLEGRKACALVSGGNIDMTLMSRIIQRGLVKEGRIAVLHTEVMDRPGAIAHLLERLAAQQANVLDVRHDRFRPGVPLHRAHVEVQVETRGPDHVGQLRKVLAEAGYDVQAELL